MGILCQAALRQSLKWFLCQAALRQSLKWCVTYRIGVHSIRDSICAGTKTTPDGDSARHDASKSSRATTDLQFLKIFKTKLVSRTLRTVAVKLVYSRTRFV